MGRQPASDTRDRILSTALELFNARGYRGTSMQKIADRLGLTKAALYYHFATKDDILNELLSPPLDRLDAAIDAAAGEADVEAVRRRFIEECVDTVIGHRRAMAVLLRDTAVYESSVSGLAPRILDWYERAYRLVAGPDAGPADYVRAAQVVAAMIDPAMFLRNVPDDVLRRGLLEGASHLLDLPTAAGTADAASAAVL